ncbi:unnamed protein product, partial [Rangifer tarandus platyrhynchus]
VEPARTPDPGFASRHPFSRREPPLRLSALACPRLILGSARAPAASAARRLHGPGAPALRAALGASPGCLLAPVPKSGDADAAAGRAARPGERANQPPPGLRAPRPPGRSPRRPGSRSAGEPPLCTWEGVCGALAPALGAGFGRVGRPSAAREPREEKEEGLAEKEPPPALAAPPTFSTAPALRRKGEDEEEEEKERGGSSSRRKSSPSYDCRMLIAAAGVPRLLWSQSQTPKLCNCGLGETFEPSTLFAPFLLPCVIPLVGAQGRPGGAFSLPAGNLCRLRRERAGGSTGTGLQVGTQAPRIFSPVKGKLRAAAELQCPRTLADGPASELRG